MSMSSRSAAPSVRRHLPRPLRVAATLLALAACPAAESVSVTLTKPNAFESDSVDGYGEYVISRAQAQTTPLAVRIQISGATASTTRDTLNTGSSLFDYRIEAVPSSAGPTPGLNGTEIVTIPAGQKEIKLRVIAYPDRDQLSGELLEAVDLRVLSDGNSGQTYTVTDTQQKTVQIIDANITAQMVTVVNAAEKIGTDVNGVPRIVGAVGRIDCLFADSSVRDASGSIRSFSPYARTVALGDQTFSGRYVEFLIGGTATRGTDYTLTHKIGGLNDGERVDQPFAYRLKAENGQDVLAGVAGYASFSNLAISPKLELPAQYFNLRVVSGLPGTFTFAGYGGFALNDEAQWGDLDGDGVLNENPTNTGNPAPTIAGNAITRVDADASGTRSRIVLKNAIPSDIRQGTKLILRYEVLKRVTTTPTTGPAITTLIPETTELNCAIDENIIYPRGSSSISVNSTTPQSISVGDIFELSTDPGMRYRVTGPTPATSQDNAVNRDATNTAKPSVGASNLNSSFISFWPPLRKPLTRDGGTANLVNEFTVDLPNGQNRFTLHIPGLPSSSDVINNVLTYGDGATTTTGLYPDGTWDGTDSNGGSYPNDMPIGDSIGFRINVLNDNVNEGAETVTISAQTSNANNNYAILNPGVASVVISDNDSVAGPTVAKSVFEGGEAGKFTVNFTNAFTRDVQVNYALLTTGLTNPANWRDGFPRAGAPADIQVEGLDPVSGTGSVTLKAGSTAVDIQVNAIPDQTIEEVQQIKLQLSDSADYVLVSSPESPQNASAATMTVTDSLGVVSLADPGTKSVYEEPTATDPRPTFQIKLARRAGYESKALTVKVDISGSAVQDLDYALTLPAGATRTGSRLEIPFPSGVNAADIVLQPLVDTLVETDETVIATLAQGDTFRLGDKTTGQAIIQNGKAPVVPPTNPGTTTPSNPTAGTTNPSLPPSTASVEQNQGGCGAGSAVALLSGLCMALGFRRRRE